MEECVLSQACGKVGHIRELLRLRATSRTLRRHIDSIIEPFICIREGQDGVRRLSPRGMLQLLIVMQARELELAREQKRLATLQFDERIFDVPEDCLNPRIQLSYLLKNIFAFLHPVHLIEFKERYERTRVKLRHTLDILFTCPSASLDIYLSESSLSRDPNYNPPKLTKILCILKHQQSFSLMLKGLALEQNGRTMVHSSKIAENFLRETEQQSFCALENPSSALHLLDPNSSQPLPVVVRSLRKNGVNLLLQIENSDRLSEMAFSLYDGRWLSNELLDSGMPGVYFSAVLQIR